MESINNYCLASISAHTPGLRRKRLQINISEHINEPSIRELNEAEDIATAIIVKNLRSMQQINLQYPSYSKKCTHSGNPDFVFPGGSFDGREVPRVMGLSCRDRWRSPRKGVARGLTTVSSGFGGRSFPSENEAMAASAERTRAWTCSKDMFPHSWVRRDAASSNSPVFA